MRSCDVSSDVCSSDLFVGSRLDGGARGQGAGARGLDVADLVAASSGRLSLRLGGDGVALPAAAVGVAIGVGAAPVAVTGDRKRVVWGRSVSVRVDLGGGRITKKQKRNNK